MGGLFEFLEENNGGKSHVRIICFLVTFALLGKNIYLTVKTGQDISLGVVECGLISSLVGWKVWQKGKENPTIVETPIIPPKI